MGPAQIAGALTFMIFPIVALMWISAYEMRRQARIERALVKEQFRQLAMFKRGYRR